jgi:hypothetical protein
MPSAIESSRHERLLCPQKSEEEWIGKQDRYDVKFPAFEEPSLFHLELFPIVPPICRAANRQAGEASATESRLGEQRLVSVMAMFRQSLGL